MDFAKEDDDSVLLLLLPSDVIKTAKSRRQLVSLKHWLQYI